MVLWAFSLIPQKSICNVKIGLLVAVRSDLPLRILIQIGKIGIRLIAAVDLGDMRRLAVGKKLPIYALSPHHIYVCGRILQKHL